MKSLIAAKTRMTLDDFLTFEETSHSYHEYRDGELYEMPPTRFAHNCLTGRMLTLLNNQFEKFGKDCHSLNCLQKIYISAFNWGIFSDVAVFCGKPLFHDTAQYLLVNPVLVVEVLSKSTQGYDKGDKFDLYRTLPSFREYVLVSQNEPEIQVRYLQDPEKDLWKITNYKGLDAAVHLHSIGMDLKLKDLYSVIEKFTEEPD